MTNEEAKEFLDNLKICINEHPIVADWLVEIADRKTEPTHDLRTETHECVKDTHDKTEPQICDTCRYYNDYIPCGSTPSACKKADKFAEEFVNGLKKLKPKDEPQYDLYDFGEYADRLWEIAYERGKREALEQTEPSCDTCKLKDTTEWCKRQEVCRAYKPKDEPQTNADQQVQRIEYVESVERSRCRKCKHFKREYETPVSSDGRYYTYITCSATKCVYEPKDEPQTDCAWR